jgi:hypothetical protein
MDTQRQRESRESLRVEPPYLQVSRRALEGNPRTSQTDRSLVTSQLR